MSVFRIDPRFMDLMPELEPAPLSVLAEDIRQNGCREPLVIWKEKGILLDGHQRHRICDGTDIEFTVREESFATAEDAMDWVIRQHVGRRNLNRMELSYFIGKLYNRAKGKAGGDRRSEAAKQACVGMETAEAFAKAQGISPATVRRYGRLTRAVEKLCAEHGNGVRKLLLHPITSPVSSARDIIRLAELDHQGQAEVLSWLTTAARNTRLAPKTVSAAIKRAMKHMRLRQRSKRADSAVIHGMEDGVCLLQGDARERLTELPDRSVDSVIVDPPWGTNSRRAWGGDRMLNDGVDEAIPLLRAIAPELVRVCKDDAHLYFIVGTETCFAIRSVLEEHFDILSMLVWDQGPPTLVDFDQRYAPCHCFIIFARKQGADHRPLNGTQVRDIIRVPRLRNPDMPGEKPVPLLEELILNSTIEGDVVLDFTMGTGSCGVAAIRTDRKFVGIEMDADRFVLTELRLAEETQRAKRAVTERNAVRALVPSR